MYTKKDLQIMNLEAMIPVLQELNPKHRHFRGLYQVFFRRLPNYVLSETDKEYLIVELEAYLNKIRNLSDEQQIQEFYGNSGCPSCSVIFHKLDSDIPLYDSLYGDCRVIIRHIDLDEHGDKYETKYFFQKFVDNQWIDLDEYTP